MKSTVQLLKKSLLCLFAATIVLACCITFFPLQTTAKTTKPKWKKEIASLEIGKTYRYQIKYCPKNAKVQFSSNHTSLAAINRKTGLLRAKKKGSVLITAKISQANKKTKKLKTKMKITKKKTAELNPNKSSALSTYSKTDNQAANNSPILEHVTFSVSETINPWNHSIMLYSNRILLQSEVQDTNLTLSPLTTKSNAKVDPILTAHFSSLSADGKTIIYQLNPDSAKKLCPGNGTLDGEYKITATFFCNTLRTHYQERIHLNSINGYVLSTDQNPLSNVTVKLYVNSQNTPLAVTTSDKNGYYQFQNITENNIRLEASLENYDSFSQSSLSPAGQNICQNIILHPSSAKNLAVSCQILDEQNHPIKNTAVILMKKNKTSTDRISSLSDAKSKKAFLQGKVDQNGRICFANQQDPLLSDGYTQIKYHTNDSVSEFISGQMPLSNSIISDSLKPMSRNQEYILYIFPAASETSIPRDYQMESFTFSFAPLLSDQLYLQIHLQKLPLLSSEKVSIYKDTLTTTVTDYQYHLYDRNGNQLFQTILSPQPEHTENDYAKQLTTALYHHDMRLPDGNYYAAITALTDYSSEKSISSDIETISVKIDSSPARFVSSATSIQPVQIHKNIISAASFTLSPCQIFRSLTYTDYHDEPLEKVSFILYQKSDATWFPIGTYTTDLFSPIHLGQKAYLELPVSIDTSYCLAPVNTNYRITSGTFFNHFPEQNVIQSSDIPQHQILFTKVSDDKNTTKDEQDLSALLDYVDLCNNSNSFLKDYFSRSASYPNTVYAYHQTDGSFTNLIFATPTFVSLENPSSNLICNQLQNGAMIHTSQKSYSTTPFFVT